MNGCALRSSARPEMTNADHQVFVRLGTAAAKRNDYLPLQWGAGRRTSGSAIDWQYGDQRIFSFLIEMGDKLVNPEKDIAPEVHRNYDALLYLMEQADCPYRVIGKAQEFCGPFFDDFETSRGWVTDPDHSDTATDGVWARGVPKADANQPAALVRANHWRTPGGLTPLNANAMLQQAAVAHAHFMSINPAGCYPGAHQEVMSSGGTTCNGFTGMQPWDRMTAAGYKVKPRSLALVLQGRTRAPLERTLYKIQRFVETVLPPGAAA